MHVSLNKDTLAYQLGVRPATSLVSYSRAHVPKVVASLIEFLGGDMSGKFDKSDIWTYKQMVNPEHDAINFYMMNHAISVLRSKTHPYEALSEKKKLLDEYHNLLSVAGTRMFFYLLLICTRESRHEKSASTSPFWTSIATKFGSEVVAAHSVMRPLNSMGAADAFRKSPPSISLGDYTNYLSHVFYKGKFVGGFGGPAWGKVSDVLRDYVHGKISTEMMLDTAFTLAHNNGPIFNKGMLFHNHSHAIYKILDVQRSGQIPQLVGNNEISYSTEPEIKGCYDFCKSYVGTAFDGYVDWFLVEELGAVKSYPSEKSTQQTLHGYPTKFKEKLEAEKIKKEIAAKKEAEEAKKWIKITPAANGVPELKVKKIEPSWRAA